MIVCGDEIYGNLRQVYGEFVEKIFGETEQF